MFSHTLLLILGGCLLGAIQLIAGLAIGLWLRRGDRSAAERGRQEMVRSGDIAKRLRTLAQEMSSSVGEHRSQLEEATQLLTSADDGGDESLAKLVVEVIGDIVRANQTLQSKLATAECRLEEQAAEIEAHISRSLTDPLTGLPNRREFNDRLEERMSAWRRRQEAFSLLLLDVDHFKKLNDEHGHLAGDQVLATLGRALRGAVRREDAVARYGGEEFAILLPNTNLEQAVHAAQKVRQTVASTAVEYNGERFAVTMSGGLAMIRDSEGPDSLIQRADSALYTAKAAGRNREFVHDGIACRSAEDFLRPQPAAAASLIELICAPEAIDSATAPIENDPMPFGTYLAHEAISPELAKTCQELRQFVEQRGQLPQETAPSCALR